MNRGHRERAIAGTDTGYRNPVCPNWYSGRIFICFRPGSFPRHKKVASFSRSTRSVDWKITFLPVNNIPLVFVSRSLGALQCVLAYKQDPPAWPKYLARSAMHNPRDRIIINSIFAIPTDRERTHAQLTAFKLDSSPLTHSVVYLPISLWVMARILSPKKNNKKHTQHWNCQLNNVRGMAHIL